MLLSNITFCDFCSYLSLVVNLCINCIFYPANATLVCVLSDIKSSVCLFLSGHRYLATVQPAYSLHLYTHATDRHEILGTTTENARPDKNGPQKTPDLILEDLTRTDQIEAMEKAGPENDGRNPLTVKF